MADLSKIKRSSLGKPPALEEASQNLTAPETAPATPILQAQTGQGEAMRFYDGRTARRSGRTLQFAPRISPDFDHKIRALANRDGLMLVELLERAVASYEKQTAN
jgi:hypothetical protein